MFNDHNNGPSDSSLLRYLVCGAVVCGAVFAAITTESSGNLFSDLFTSVLIVLGAFFAIALIGLAGAIVDRVFLGNDDIDPPNQNKLRIWLCITALLALVFCVVFFF